MFCCVEFFFSFLLEITFIQEGAPRKSYKHENLCITVPSTASMGNGMTQVFHRGRASSRRPEAKRRPGAYQTPRKVTKVPLCGPKNQVFSKIEARSGYSGLARLPVGLGFSSTANSEMIKQDLSNSLTFRGSLCDNINRESESAKSTSADDGGKSRPRTTAVGVSWGAGRCFRSSLAAPGSSLW